MSVRNRALNAIRDRSGVDVDHELASIHSKGQPADHDLNDNENDEPTLEQLMNTWIDQLPDRQKEAFNLSRFEGLDHDEIAEVMNVSPKTVNNHIVTALRSLRDKYEQYDNHS